jgi:hypothetical protein
MRLITHFIDNRLTFQDLNETLSIRLSFTSHRQLNHHSLRLPQLDSLVQRVRKNYHSSFFFSSIAHDPHFNLTDLCKCWMHLPDELIISSLTSQSSQFGSFVAVCLIPAFRRIDLHTTFLLCSTRTSNVVTFAVPQLLHWSLDSWPVLSDQHGHRPNRLSNHDKPLWGPSVLTPYVLRQDIQAILQPSLGVHTVITSACVSTLWGMYRPDTHPLSRYLAIETETTCCAVYILRTDCRLQASQRWVIKWLLAYMHE